MAGNSGKEIDRQTTAPFLLRLFYKKGAYVNLDDFTLSRLPQHLQIYTWESCTLSELTHLFLTALPSLLPNPFTGSRIVFQLVYPDLKSPSARYISRELGNIIVGATSDDRDVHMNEDEDDAENVKHALKQLEGELNKTLQDAKFIVGDYIVAAVFPPHPDGTVPDAPPPPRAVGRGPPPRDGFGGRGGRENGFGGRSDYGHGGRGRGGGRYDDRRGGGVPSGEWRRGDIPPERDNYWRGGGGGGEGRGGRSRGGGRW